MTDLRRTRVLLLASLCFVTTTAVAADPPPRTFPYTTFLDRLRGGWAGQMVGVSYGSVYEFKALGHPYTGPIRTWRPEFVSNSIQQDDLYVEMTFLKVLQEHGICPTARQAGEAFRDSKYRLWHANDAGRTNLRAGIFPPDSGHPRYNPHSDDIDFQIEADLFGLIAPGLYGESARLCDLFGTIMNYGDGVYGGRLIAAMYGRAYLESDPTPEAIARVVDAGLKAIPEKSRYAMLVRDIVAWHRENPSDWLATWRKVEDKWGHEDLCPEGLDRPFNIDAKVNGGYIVIGLLYGGGDLEKTMEITTRCGQDADCNPSSAAGVLGTIYGYSRSPAKFTAGIPALSGQKFEYTDYDYPALIAACEQVAVALLERAGGKVETRNGTKMLVLPAQSPAPPATLEQLFGTSPDDLRKWREEFDARKAKLRAR